MLAAVAMGANGCSKAPTGTRDKQEAVGLKEDPWKALARRLKKDSERAETKLALDALANDLRSQDKEPLPIMTDEGFAKLSDLVPLSPVDREDIRSATFSSHDSVYVSDCLMMRDAARSLALTGLPPEQQVELAFAWVCRQVYLQPWLRVPDRHEGATALSPTAVLRRGFGSGLERMYVFLALLQQLELDGCLIGAPDAGSQPAGLPILTADKKAYVTGAPRGPFWTVGVRIGTDVKLFDPWRRPAVPGHARAVEGQPGHRESVVRG